MNVLIADDDPIVVSSLKIILESDADIHVLGTAENGEDAIALYLKMKPDVALLDIRMGRTTGIDAAGEILAADPDARILFLTTFTDDEYLESALRLRVKGYMLKQEYDRIIPSLKAVMAGQSVFGGAVMAKLPALISRGTENGLKTCGLDRREIKIVELIASGFTNREISNELFLSEGTIRNCVSVILEKLGVRDRTQIAIMYYNSEFISQKGLG